MVYKRDVCEVIEIKKNHFNNNDYYILAPLFDKSLKIEVPVANRVGHLRELLSKEEIGNIISQIPNIEALATDNRYIENQYKTLMSSGEHTDLIKIIKTAYLRNQERIDNNKKIGDKDNNYFCQAEKYLYQEFSIVLGMSYDETKEYVVNEVNKYMMKKTEKTNE